MRRLPRSQAIRPPEETASKTEGGGIGAALLRGFATVGLWTMASRVWAMMEETDSSTCRSCHDFTFMDLSDQDRSARRKHDRAIEEGRTCIECHKGLVHEEPDEPAETSAALN